MKHIKKFILTFTKAEYNFNSAQYDMTISDSECIPIAKKASSFFSSFISMSDRYERANSIENRKNDSKWIERYAKKKQRILSRTLFQIKHYKNPKLGENLQKIVVDDNLYACYVSYTQKSEDPIDYNKIFYVAETNEGIKIIYDITYGVRDKKWRHSHDLEVLQVIDAGELIAVEKYQAPEEESSLADYNKD